VDYVKLGNTGLDVSPICLGCMSFGSAEGWVHNPWALDEEASRAIIQRALDLGINFFDTANVYAFGSSEEILGRALKDLARREEVVIATKVFGQMSKAPNGGGLSRKHIMSQVDQSLKRLGMDYIDLYIIHRWDYDTPIEETMAALHDVVKAGKARYIGASAMYAWQFQKALYAGEKNGWTRFVSMQNHMNLIYREEEREMMPLCRAEKIAVTPYSPLASGRLARDWSETTERYETDPIARMKYGATAKADKQVVERVAEVAEKHAFRGPISPLPGCCKKNPWLPLLSAQPRSLTLKARSNRWRSS
jgi:1-deoxyxylulose-5-phosphate synthase